MALTRYEVQELTLPARVSPAVGAAKEQLRVAHTTLQGIFDSLHVVRTVGREAKDNRGPLTEAETDLLRSAVVLAGAGLEAVIKRLASDALPGLLENAGRHPGALKKYREYVRSVLQDQKTPGRWLEAIISDDPRPQMVRLYVESLVTGSIQSEGDLRSIRDALGLDADAVSDESLVGLRGFLTARNQIAHDLDLRKPEDPGNGRRYKRTAKTVVTQCDEVLAVATAYICGVAKLMPERRRRS